MTVDYGDIRLPERFWSLTYPEPNTGCWLWGGALRATGHGSFSFNDNRNTSHRIAYLALVGPLDDGRLLGHTCGVSACCNPSHLRPQARQAETGCKVAGCPETHDARGYCDMHYQRVRRGGDVGPVERTVRVQLTADSPEPLVRDVFATHYEVDAETGCWLWQKDATEEGYGRFYMQGRKFSAHRFSYEMHVGPIPDGLELDHLCRRPPCVNPDHLEPVTGEENSRRAAAARATCIHGHPFEGANLAWRLRNGNWHRVCRACAARASREYQKRRKAI